MLKNQGGGGGSSAAAAAAAAGATWVRGTGEIMVPVGDVDVYISAPCTIQGVIVLTEGGPGSCVVDVWRAGYSAFPPTVLNTITASAKPTISNGIKFSDAVLTGWNKACVAGDVLRFHLDSSSTFTRISVFLILG